MDKVKYILEVQGKCDENMKRFGMFNSKQDAENYFKAGWNYVVWAWYVFPVKLVV